MRPSRAYSTHDGLVNEIGHKLIGTWLGMESDKQKADMRRIPVGESVDVP